MYMYPRLFLKTDRLRTAYYRAGKDNAPKLLLIHGNLTSAFFFLPLFPFLSRFFDVVAPDLRCFGETQDLPVDATRGYRDWSDDLASLVKALGWEKHFVAGWSLGGDVAMQYTIDHAPQVERLVLIAPVSPFGFGGSRGPDGQPLDPPGLASGGGTANPQLVMALSSKSRLVLRRTLNQFFFVPPFRMGKAWEERMIDEIGKINVGPGRWPGNSRYVAHWPFVAAGDNGVLNTMTPIYGNLSALADVEEKPPILWIRGNTDKVVSDHSELDFGTLGSIGIIPGWPGHDAVPPQPMVTQTRWLLDRYREKGGEYLELVIPGGHMCFLEWPQHFTSAVCSFLLQ